MPPLTNVSVFLVDFDEVMYRHPAAHAIVSRRVVSLLSDRLRIGASAAEVVNRRLYGVYGHTLLGLREELGDNLSVEEFNAEVYAPSTLREVARLPRHPDTDVRAADAERMLQRVRAAGVRPYLFSNAPRVWCEFALAEIGLSRAFTSDQMLTSDSYAAELDLILKPATMSYDLVRKYVRTDAIAFLDDSIRNLVSAPRAWRKYLMCNSAADGAKALGMVDVTPITHLDLL